MNKLDIVGRDDGKQANLGVSRDVLWNGAFSTESICAEYFGGILASSRSEDGKDDSAIPFVTDNAEMIRAMVSSTRMPLASGT